jgi:hypothetical protein
MASLHNQGCWSRNDILRLMERMEKNLPPDDSWAFKTTQACLDWGKVIFKHLFFRRNVQTQVVRNFSQVEEVLHIDGVSHWSQRTWTWVQARILSSYKEMCSPQMTRVCKKSSEKNRVCSLQGQTCQRPFRSRVMAHRDQKGLCRRTWKRTRGAAPQTPAVEVKIKSVTLRTVTLALLPRGTPRT